MCGEHVMSNPGDTTQGSPLKELGTALCLERSNQPEQRKERLNLQLNVDTKSLGLGCGLARSEGKSIGKRRQAGLIWVLQGQS